DIHLKGLGAPPAKKPKKTTFTEGERKGKQLGWGLIALLVVFLATLQIVGIINVTTAQGLAQAMGIIIVSVAMVYFFYILLAGGLDRTEKNGWGYLSFSSLSLHCFGRVLNKRVLPSRFLRSAIHSE